MGASYSVQNEVWGEFAVGSLFLILRLVARHKIVGFRNFRIDDFLTVLALGFYCAVTVEAYILNFTKNPIGLTTETALLIPEEDIPEYVKGGKLLFTGWLAYIFFLWSLKSVLLTLYFRMASGLQRELLYVKIVAAYVAAAFAVCFLNHVCQCTPIEHNWQAVPYPGDQCVTRNQNYYVIASMNITTDIAIMALPLPILAKTTLSTFRKLLLAVLLSSGVFIMICSILRAYYSLRDISLLVIAIGWISREMMVACIAVSAPAIKPLFNHIRFLRGSSFSGGDRSKTPGGRGNGTDPQQYIEMGSKGRAKNSNLRSQWAITKADSQENIISNDANDNKDGIQVTTEYAVETTHSSTPSGSHRETDSIV